jgi:hypothetical protein
MSAREYDNFDLLIEAIGRNDYRVHITSCPVGDTPSARFGLPFSTTELETCCSSSTPVGPECAGSSSRTPGRRWISAAACSTRCFGTTCWWPGREARMLRGTPATVFACDYD